MDNKNEIAYEDEKKYVSFGIRFDQLITSEVSRQLNLEMTHGFDTRSEHLNKRTGEKYTLDFGVWQHNSRNFVQSDKIEDHLEYILHIFENRIDRLQPFLDEESCYVALWIHFEGGIGITSFSLSNEILSRIMKICNEINNTLCVGTLCNDCPLCEN